MTDALVEQERTGPKSLSNRTTKREVLNLKQALALVVLLAAGGLRCSETANAAVADWDAGTSRLVVACGKGRTPRVVPMPTWAAERIDAWLDGHPGDGRLLRAIDRWGNLGEQLSPRGVSHLLAGLCAAAGIETISPHALRAHRITEIIEASDPLLAQHLAGHAQVMTTARYDGTSADSSAESSAYSK